MSDQKNMILAMALALLVFVGWDLLVLAPEREAREQAAQNQPATSDQTATPAPDPGQAAPPVLDADANADAVGAMTSALKPRADALADSPRVMIETPRLTGSIALTGARFDDLVLVDYWETVEQAAQIKLLNPAGAEDAYFAEFGWTAAASAGLRLPGRNDRWIADRPRLTPQQPVTLRFDNGQGLIFTRTISVDEDFMFTIEQQVENTSGVPVTLAPYALISRTGTPKTSQLFVIHEGPLGVLDGTLSEIDYDELREESPIEQQSKGGWLGITDKYWLTTLVPDQDRAFRARFLHGGGVIDRYQVDFREEAITLASGESAKVDNRFFAGAKEVKLIDRYAEQYGITRFDRTIDWGWFYFLTRPIFFVLDLCYRLLGNFGVAIIALTFLVRLLMFPLANKQFESMSRMRKVQPKMKALQERFKDDKMRLQQELMALYKREKVNPLAGCLPILVQIPVFFALYKVLLVTIEMRHAPFFGWIADLSAPDPLTPVNLFGLLPFTPPSFLAIGIWPIIMGVSMWLQMRLNPTPPDPIQARIFGLMPFIFTFILAPFAVGLVVYWTCNNLLSIAQQWIIMRRIERE